MPNNSVLKWHGGKCYLAPKFVALMPRHVHYVEPFAGGAAVLLARDPNDESLWLPPHEGVSEVLNDLNGELVHFWRTLAHKSHFAEMKRVLDAVPLSHPHFDQAEQADKELAKMFDSRVPGGIERTGRAVRFFIRARQSRAGTFKGFTSLTRNRLRRGINGNASEWLGAIECLPAVHARLQPVVIENMDALKLIRREDTPGTLFYCDPPYLYETRVTKDAYAHEMTDEQHEELWRTLGKCKGKWMLSGYSSTLYESMASIYAKSRHTFDIANNAAGGKEKRRMTECLWCNF